MSKYSVKLKFNNLPADRLVIKVNNISPVLLQNRCVNSIKNHDMNALKKITSLLLLTATVAVPFKSWSQKTGFKVLNDYKISSPGGWDYILVDGANKRVYVSHGSQVNVISTTGDSLGYIPKTNGVHGIALVHSLNKGFTSNGRANSVTVFDLKALK